MMINGWPWDFAVQPRQARWQIDQTQYLYGYGRGTLHRTRSDRHTGRCFWAASPAVMYWVLIKVVGWIATTP